jgi:pyruvate kinase
MKKTKLITTICQDTCSYDELKDIINAGTDVIRINLSYANKEFCNNMITSIRKLEKELDKPIGIMLDINGPSVRLSDLNENEVALKLDKKVKIYNYPVLCNDNQVCTNTENITSLLEVGDVLMMSDDEVEMVVREISNDYVSCEVIKEGIIHSREEIHLKNRNFKLPFLDKDDYESIMYCIDKEIDFMTLSCVNDEQDVLSVSDMLIENNDNHIQLISKIETQDALDNLEEIVKASDGVMIDRSDLSLEAEIEKLPLYQKTILNMARKYEKIGIIASDMLMDITESTRPERSLVIDIYNAVLDNCDAILLSGKTNKGEFPIETISMMNKILESAEEDFDYLDNLTKTIRDTKQDITSSIAYSVVDSSIRLKTKAIIANTNSGYTGRKISYFRPVCPIIGLSPNMETIRSLTLTYGVIPILSDECKTTDQIVKMCLKKTIPELSLLPQDIVIITGGFPANSKTTNFMKIEVIE